MYHFQESENAIYFDAFGLPTNTLKNICEQWRRLASMASMARGAEAVMLHYRRSRLLDKVPAWALPQVLDFIKKG